MLLIILPAGQGDGKATCPDSHTALIKCITQAGRLNASLTKRYEERSDTRLASDNRKRDALIRRKIFDEHERYADMFKEGQIN